ncbi:MAG: dephospho-CoA kinase [Chloroflexi bacterium]|nr:dephospho-CoA kinase [Chloroflexota bacterium]MBU1749365.1 dephospho-CoA kinase [Chloroflexota bacterium]
MTYIIGLTGNIATGKSTVAHMLADLGAQVVDADAVAHAVMRRGRPAWQDVVLAFGEDILGPDGEIDRGKLGAIVFRDPAALARLEAIAHPAVIREMQALARRSTAPVLVREAIKLIESGAADECDAVWVVTAPRAVQVERLMRTRGLSRAEAELRIDAQPPQEEKMARADVVIDNGGTLEETRRQVERAWRETVDII